MQEIKALKKRIPALIKKTRAQTVHAGAHGSDEVDAVTVVRGGVMTIALLLENPEQNSVDLAILAFAIQKLPF